MTTMKLISKFTVRVCGALLALSAIATPSPAQVAGGAGGAGAHGGRPFATAKVIYVEYEASDGLVPMHCRLRIDTDGTATLEEERGALRRKASRKLDRVEVDALTTASGQERALARRLDAIAASLAPSVPLTRKLPRDRQAP